MRTLIAALLLALSPLASAEEWQIVTWTRYEANGYAPSDTGRTLRVTIEIRAAADEPVLGTPTFDLDLWLDTTPEMRTLTLSRASAVWYAEYLRQQAIASVTLTDLPPAPPPPADGATQ